MTLPVFVEDAFSRKFVCGDKYNTPTSGLQLAKLARFLPSFSFYSRLFLGPFAWLCRRAAKGLCDDYTWVYASIMVAELLEQTGCQIHIEGMDVLDSTQGPCVFVANHMSTLETFMLPGIIRPRRKVTFVVKKSLVTLPLFGAVMRSRDPVVVGRENPRKDLITVLNGGIERLKQGISIIIFPQHTRSKVFEPEHFNSIGVKLAQKADVPLIPIALKTDAWGQGKPVKDFGAITPTLPIHFRFAPAMRIEGAGKTEQKAICQFIGSCLQTWSGDVSPAIKA